MNIEISFDTWEDFDNAIPTIVVHTTGEALAEGEGK
jgi:hypothetical protein